MFSQYTGIKYHEPVFRPPSEGKSLLIQVTHGCSNNKCTYCAMYRSKQYRVRSLEEIFSDIHIAAHNTHGQWHNGKIFLCDGDALGAPMEVLVPVIEEIRKCFPKCRRFGIYATAENMLEKSDQDLKMLSDLGLNIAYLGMESGCDKVLKLIVKGNSSADMIEAGHKIHRAGWKLSIIAMLGLGGTERSSSHVQQTARLISEINPRYFSVLTTMSIPGTPYEKTIQKGFVTPLDTRELLTEMRDILQLIEVKNPMVFRANHVSNMFPVGGTFPKDQPEMVQQIQQWISSCPSGVYPDHSHGSY